MSTFFVLADGRAWLSWNWMFDEVLESVASVLGNEDELAKWLLEQRCVVQGPGVGFVDLRHLTRDNQRRILDALPNALAISRPRLSPRGVAEFERLLLMVNDPSVIDHNVAGPFPDDGEKKGPGWP